MMKTEYSEIWELLQKQTIAENTSHMRVRRIIPGSKLDVFIGIQQPNNKRIFAVEVDSNQITSIKSLPKFKGIEIFSGQSISDREDRVCLFVQLKSVRFNDLFSVLISDIAAELIDTSDEKEALSLLFKRLIEWQQFVEHEDSELLTSESLRGLFGELTLLHKHLIPNLGTSGVLTWKGFNATQQDFYIANDAIEVKTSAAKQHQKITISSERQLESKFYKNLYLYHLSLDEIIESKSTLPALIEDIHDSIKHDPVAVKHFSDGLYDIGYLNDHEAEYSKNGYEIREENLFHVSDDFPRIIEDDLRPGVGDVSYTVMVAECKHHTVDLSIFSGYRGA